jgi:hypothetical protein
MKQLRSILSFAFALLVLFSSSNLMVGLHFCGGNIQNVALFSKADVCAMEEQMPPCHRQQANTCCDDETLLHNRENFNAPTTDISFSPELLGSAELPAVLISEVIPASPFSRTQYYNYDPPLREIDLNVSLHTFLI